MTSSKSFNPFYILLLISGVAFAITACSYGVMTVRQLSSGRSAGYRFESDETTEVGQPKDFNAIMDAYGAKAMIWEIVLLGIGTVGAIAYDQHLDKKEAQAANQEN